MLDDATRLERVLRIRSLDAQITELNAGNFRLLTLIAEFDRLHGWGDGAG